ncbi:MAG: LysR family transcriptional regulator [Cyanobacteria bacterium P01_G01_bin.38]
MKTLDLNALVVFAQVVKQGSFIGAARHLDLPKATVSRRIQQLEDALQVKLLERSTRVVRPTELGQIYYGYCDRILTEIEEARAAVDAQQAEPAGLLRTSAPSAFTQLFIKELIPEFLDRYPQIRLIHRIVNHSVNPLRDGFDVSIRIGQLEDSQLRIQPLGEATPQLFASPLYLEQYGMPNTPSDLVNHRAIVTGTSNRPQWMLFNHDKREVLDLVPRCVVNDPTLACSLVVSKVGIGLLPTFLCTEAMQSKQIERILPNWHGAKVPLNAVFPTTYERSPKIKVFLQFLKERLSL